MNNLVDKCVCNHCGQVFNCPTQPGRWKFRYLYSETKKWTYVDVVKPPHGEDGLFIIPKGSKHPIWWPEQCEWRKICN